MDEYLIDLLYLHDCVVIPNFGGFVTRRVPAQLKDGVFYPPKKEIAFNACLTENDGLLAHHIAKQHPCTYEQASEIIADALHQ